MRTTRAIGERARLRSAPSAARVVVAATALAVGAGGAAPPVAAATAAPERSFEEARRGTVSEAWAEPLKRARRGLVGREYRVSDDGRGLQAPNRAHGLRTYFGSTDIRVHDRAAPGGPGLLALSLAGVGRGDVLSEPAPGGVTSEGTQVKIRRGALLEWYENSARGLEQGFTLSERPAGEGPLAIELAVEDATASLRGDGVVFATDAGRRLRYGELRAWDARGRDLGARLEVTPAGDVRLEVEDADAEYPVVVDPLLTKMADEQLEPDQAEAHFGSSVAAAGDVNGDGYGDLVVGAPSFDTGSPDAGAAFVYLGPGLGSVTQLDVGQGSFGSSVASAGDVDGDGYDDVVVGAPGYSSGESAEGAAFVFLGSATGIAASPASQLEGNQDGSGFGTSVASAGDVDGDGFADVIVGAESYDAGETDEGAAFIFPGGPGGIPDGSPATAATQLESDQAEFFPALFGHSVASAGDVDGDGYSDVVVGAPAYDAQSRGGVFVFLGSAAGVADADPSTAATEISAPFAGQELGGSVASAGDVDGDGYADVIVADGSMAYVFLGSPTGIPDASTATADTRLQGDVGGPLGSSVASAGDVNGDGYADVVVGARLYEVGETDEGAAFVFLGGAGGIPDSNPFGSYARVEPDQAGADFGQAVAAAGDVNGDGYGDLLVGARYYDGGEIDEGAAFLFHGGASDIDDGSLDTLLGPFDAQARLESDQASSGWSVASAGDVNGDGYGDVLVAASSYDAGQTDEGVVFLFLGGAGGLADGGPATADARLEGDQAGARFGYSADSAGDVNGDGYGDVIVGARFYQSGEVDEGAAFLFLGGPAGLSDGGPATADARLEGDQTGAEFGADAASAGDVDGDGYADVVVSAPGFDAGETDEGAAFVFLGDAAGIADGSTSTAHARVETDQADAHLFSVASAGDVNGDGYADVLVGAPAYGVVETGSAFVFLGSASGIAGGGPPAADVWIGGDGTTLGHIGWSVASVGDTNGDGLSDFAVGMPGLFGSSSDEGLVVVYAGNEDPSRIGGFENAAAIYLGDQPGSRFGQTVTSAGDVNGDGLADVAVGAPGYDFEDPDDDEGSVFVFLGTPALEESNPALAGSRVVSQQPGAGLAGVGSGDVDGDGFSDVFVSASGFDDGAAFIFYGNGNRGGRPVRARQLRGDASGVPVQPWGSSGAPDAFAVRMAATHPAGRGRVKLEVERCGLGIPFGAPSCARFVSPSWTDTGATSGGALLGEVLPIPFGDLLVRWRARVLRASPGVTEPGITAPPNPPHGPWLRHLGQALEADLRRQMGAAVPVATGTGVGASALGGAGTYGGVEAVFDDTTGGTLSVDFVPAPVDESLADLLDDPAGVDYRLASDPLLLWEIEYDGTFSGDLTLTFQYDDASLAVPESDLQVEHLEDGSWVTLPKVAQDTVADTITVTTSSASPFVLGAPGGSGGWAFSGVAQGGSIRFTVGAVFLSVETTSGQTAAQVAAAVAAAINADPDLQAAGISAAADGRRVTTDGVVTSTTLDDPGLGYAPVSTQPVHMLPLAGLALLASLLAVASRRALG